MKKIIYSLLSATLLFSACEDRLNIEQKVSSHLKVSTRLMMTHRMRLITSINHSV